VLGDRLPASARAAQAGRATPAPSRVSGLRARRRRPRTHTTVVDAGVGLARQRRGLLARDLGSPLDGGPGINDGPAARRARDRPWTASAARRARVGARARVQLRVDPPATRARLARVQLRSTSATSWAGRRASRRCFPVARRPGCHRRRGIRWSARRTHARERREGRRAVCGRNQAIPMSLVEQLKRSRA